MRRNLGLVLLFLASTASAQVLCQLGNGTGYDRGRNATPSNFARQQLERVYLDLCPRGCGWTMLFENTTAPNALTEVFSPGYSVIVYQRRFMNDVNARMGPEAAYGILAHEFGHHIDMSATPAWMSTSWSRELKADAWAGCALAIRGFGTAPLGRALQAVAANPSVSHPSWRERVPAVQTGYFQCGGLLGRWLEAARGLPQ
jgi:hypothetical protein